MAKSGGGYGVARGTSFAAPLVAGLIAAGLGTPPDGKDGKEHVADAIAAARAAAEKALAALG